MKIVRKLKYKYSEPFRIRVGVGLSPIRNKREYNALIKFCENELKELESDQEYKKNNYERWKVYAATIVLHRQNLSDDPGTYLEIRKFQLTPRDKIVSYNDVTDFIDDHVAWYWN